MRYLVLGGLAALGLAAYFTAQPDAPASAPAASAAGTTAAAAPQAGVRWFDAAVLHAQADAPPGPGTLAAPAPYGRNGRALDFGGLSAAAYIAAHASQARTGDSKAAYQVYQAESVCASSDDTPPEFRSPAELEQFQRERARLQQLCANVTPAQIQERMQFLAQAAHAGNAQAQIDFYMEGPNGKPADASQDSADPQLLQWKADAVAYLKDAAAQCDHFALSLLSNAYASGDVEAVDPKLAMAYNVAAISARKGRMTADGLQRQYSGLSQADFDAGLQLGRQIASDSCKQ